MGTYKHWQNQYIELAASIPEYIIAASNTELDDDQQEQLLNTVKHYPRCYCELGSGSGGHLIARASADPQNLYLGFELRYKRTVRTAEKAALQGLSNLLVVRSNAFLLPKILPPDSLDGVFINFPDPWAKRRWQKHRLLNEDFMNELRPLIKLGGLLSYKTDHQEYFAATATMFENLPGYTIVERIDNLLDTNRSATNIRSEFEMLFNSKGVPVQLLEVQRTS